MTRRTPVIALALAAVALGAALVGCASGSTGGVSTSGTDNNAPRAVILGLKDDGTTAGVAVGGTVTVKLPGNPTTGYTWAVDDTLPPQLQAQGSPTFESGAAAGVVGAGGEVALKFTANTRGSADLKLKYWRSFEATTPPVKTWSATVDVK
jgi:predicted secreted protein